MGVQRNRTKVWTCVVTMAGYLMSSSFAQATEETSPTESKQRTWEQAFIIDASGLAKDEDDVARIAVEQRIYQRGRGEFDLQDINLLAAPLQDLTIRLVVKWSSPAQESYLVVSELQQAGRLIDLQLEPSTCEFCTENELIDQAIDHLHKVMKVLPTLVVEKPKTPAISALTPLPEEQAGMLADAPAPLQKNKPSALKIIGYSLSGTGILALGAGIGLFIKGKTGTFDQGYQTTNQELRTGGLALAIVGASLFAGGIVPLVVDFSRTKKQKRMAAYPMLERESVGISFSGHF